MSVLVKEFEMPEACDECNFHRYHSDGEYVCVATPLLYPFNLANSKGIRKDWCPLVEVPAPHGDLIDRDALEADILPEWNGLYAPDNAYSEKLICNAPIVIEAERTE